MAVDLPGADAGWDANMTYLRERLELAMRKLTLMVRPSKKFQRWKPEDVADADIRANPGRPRLFEIGEFPFSPPMTAGKSINSHAVRSTITVYYPVGGKWLNVIASDYEVIRRYLLDTFQSTITMPDLSYVTLDALEGSEPEPIEDRRGQWMEFPLLFVVDISGG